MVRQVAALFADELVVQAAVGHVAAPVVRAEGQLLRTRVLLVRLLVFDLIAHSNIIIDLMTGVDLLLLLRDTSHGIANAMRVHGTVTDHLLIQITRSLVVSEVVRVLELAKVAGVIHTDTDSAAMNRLLLPCMTVLLHQGSRLRL